MKNILSLIFLTAIVMTGCSTKERSENPFLNDTYDTPFEVPPFEKIKTSHYMPAYLQGIEEQKSEIRAIITNKQEPTFENTIKALEYSGKLMTRVSRVFGSLNSANTNDTLQQLNKELSPILSKHRDDISLNDTLFLRVKSVYENHEKFNLNDEEEKVLEDTYKNFIRSGAGLSAEDKNKLRKINEELSLLSVQFGQNLLAETNDFKLIIDKKEDLSGLPEGVIAQAAQTAKSFKMDGKWVFTIQYPIMEPFLKYSDKRELRQKLFTAYFMKGDNDNDRDNKKIIARIANLRVERSKLLGYNSYADFVLERNMAKTPDRVKEFLGQVWAAATPVAKAEAAAQQELINSEGGKFKLEPWDWWYYSDKIKKARYDLDDEITRPYFKIDNVMEGMFYVANQLYGLEFTKRTDIPKYHPDVNTFEVKRNGQHVGILLIDNYPRPSKRNGAWCGAFRGQSRDINEKMITPVVTMVTNSTPPAADKPSLLTAYEAETLFHEFGHALHQLLSNSTYPGVSGTSVPRDFVELPSQIMEHWVLEPEVLKVYARHYQTGEVIPAEIVEKLDKASKFNTGFVTVEYLAASLLDMEYHSLTEPVEFDIHKFEMAAMDKYGLIPEIKPRYRSTYFNHIWASGYASGYYAYMWSEILDADAFQAFKETGNIFNKEVAARFEKEILSKGGTRDPLEMYIAFRGKEPGIDALLINRGLK
ncbi:MAG: peptidase M3 [Bacteroidetes bacterium GWE2_41_25]|nr:MAG: peptidase M3 [Bacteroidetes bacterium GWA2_40_15]OFX86133.1 MAG: peptidase M3 [Bacteroidetes bacterium GWC2_40_22]OFY12762.1 MAG: peptidase M3 [Bacteroidetes bacterium GWE2_41_25]OFY60217.1 MAG: peptidase M3 [Bacteroidetes bacterium GWF2_41_9]HBH85937.1 peptidase M3 [Bacteroidales bacterium]